MMTALAPPRQKILKSFSEPNVLHFTRLRSLTFQNFCQAGKKKRKNKEAKATAQEEECAVSEKSLPEPHFVY
jgi:hypothetical protein